MAYPRLEFGAALEELPQAALEGANRERGKFIWAAAGEYLGFKPITVPVDGADGQRPVTVYKPQKTSNDNSSTMMATAPISVNMGGVNFTFGGGVSHSSEVMAAIREQMPSISNELAAEIARQLRRVFHNSVAEGV